MTHSHTDGSAADVLFLYVLFLYELAMPVTLFSNYEYVCKQCAVWQPCCGYEPLQKRVQQLYLALGVGCSCMSWGRTTPMQQYSLG